MEPNIDYKALYEEARERAKQIKYGNPSSGTAIVVCEQIFPDLAESEDERIRDERIRKEIIGFIEWSLERGSITTEQMIASQSWFAYLERQKEPVMSKKGFYYYDGKKVTYCHFPPIKENPYDFAMSQQEQKPTEWSEEDEKNLELVIDCVYEFYPDTVMKYKLKDWLKSIRPQPKQEWSEEDERILKGILGKIDHDQTYGVSKMEMLSFLKRLRPSWKPSRGQMSMLLAVINEPNNASSESCHLALAGLYDELKKL